MQQRLLGLALLVALVDASSVSAEAWMRSHRSPTDDQLGALKNVNPDAYAMVKALLTKRSMGLVKLAPSERGPDVFRRMMTPHHLALPAAEQSVALPYADAEVAAAQPVLGNPMQYNANAAADKDEASVDKLLAAVAGLTGKKGKKIALLRKRHHHESEDPFAADAAMFGVEDQPTPAPVQAVAAPEVQKQSAPAVHKVNPYLDGLDLTGDMPEVVGGKHTTRRHASLESHSNFLTSFSFGEEAPAEAPKPVVAAKPKKNNVFLKWLGVVKKAPAPKAAESSYLKQAGQKGNPYLVDFLA